MQVFIVCLYMYCPWRSVNRFNPAIFLYPSQARNGKSYVVILYVFSELRWDVIACFIDIGGIDDHHCLNFLFLTYSSWLYLCSYLYFKLLFYLHCPPATYLTPAQHHKIIVQWWYTCKNDIWLNFFLSMKNICLKKTK